MPGPKHLIYEVRTVNEAEANRLMGERVYASGPGGMDMLPLWHLRGSVALRAGSVEIVHHVMHRVRQTDEERRKEQHGKPG